jgi:abhydrolase domain-containing protein 12
MVLEATFSDLATLTATYRLGGIIPVLSLLSRLPWLLAFFNGFFVNTWRSKDHIAEFIQRREKTGQMYHLTLIHAEDDVDIPWLHAQVVCWHAVNATLVNGIS